MRKGDGVVVFNPPASHGSHEHIDAELMYLLFDAIVESPGDIVAAITRIEGEQLRSAVRANREDAQRDRSTLNSRDKEPQVRGLIPCPFCGNYDEENFGCDGHFVRCAACGAQGPEIYPVPSRVAATARWNSRFRETCLEGLSAAREENFLLKQRNELLMSVAELFPFPIEGLDINTTQRISAALLLEVANRYWKTTRQVHAGAVQWVASEDGSLLLFTRREYLDTLYENIAKLPLDEVRYVSEERDSRNYDTNDPDAPVITAGAVVSKEIERLQAIVDMVQGEEERIFVEMEWRRSVIADGKYVLQLMLCPPYCTPCSGEVERKEEEQRFGGVRIPGRTASVNSSKISNSSSEVAE